MMSRIVLLAVLLPISGICQVEGPGTRVAREFTRAGIELYGEFRGEFFDSEGPSGAMEGAHYFVASTPIAYGTNKLLIVYVPEAMGKTGKRKYFIAILNTKTGYRGPATGLWCDNREAKFEVLNDMLIVSCTDNGKPTRRLMVNMGDERFYPAPTIGLWNYKGRVDNMLVNNFKFTSDDLPMFFVDRNWSKLKVEQLRKKYGLAPQQVDMLNLLIDQAPSGARGSVGKSDPGLTIKGTKFKSVVTNGPLIGILYFIAEPVRGRDSCVVNMDPIPYEDGKITGLTRTIYLDKGPKVIYTFIWHDGNRGGQPFTFDADSKSVKQPEPIVSLLGDRFVKIVTRDGANREKVRYAIMSRHDLLALPEISKQEMPYIRNSIFARYGYKFKNPAYQNYFEVFDWYKPEHDDAAVVSNTLMNADEREIVNQLAELEKTAK